MKRALSGAGVHICAVPLDEATQLLSHREHREIECDLLPHWLVLTLRFF